MAVEIREDSHRIRSPAIGAKNINCLMFVKTKNISDDCLLMRPNKKPGMKQIAIRTIFPLMEPNLM